jgi:hypothetical protein
MPERVLFAFYGLLLTEVALLITSSVAFLALLRWRHANVWRSIGSPWFSFMQSFLKPSTKKYTQYVRNRHYRQLSDPLSRRLGGLVQFQLRFGPWVIITLSLLVGIVLWASRSSHVS